MRFYRLASVDGAAHGLSTGRKDGSIAQNTSGIFDLRRHLLVVVQQLVEQRPSVVASTSRLS